MRLRRFLGYAARQKVRADEKERERRQERPADDFRGRKLPSKPEHDGRHVAYRRPRAARIRRDDDDRRRAHEVPAAEEARTDREHHEGRGQVIEGRRKEERNEADDPQLTEAAELKRLYAVADDVEKTVAHEYFDERHRRQKKDDQGKYSRADRFHRGRDHFSPFGNAEQDPKERAGRGSRQCLMDAVAPLKRYEYVAADENNRGNERERAHTQAP